MNKVPIYIVLFLLSSISTLASPTMYKTWIGEHLETLEMKEGAGHFYGSNPLNRFGASYKNDTLTITNNTFSTPYDYTFKVLRLTKDTLIVSPLNANARGLIDNKNKFVFVDKAHLYKAKLKFQKVFFSATSCYGGCPGMKIEIDSSGLVHFLAEKNVRAHYGLYEGQLSSEQLKELIEILKGSELDRLPTEFEGATDAPTYNFKFYYNGKSKSSRGFFFPRFNSPLLSYLLSIYLDIEFEKMDGVYEFEK